MCTHADCSSSNGQPRSVVSEMWRHVFPPYRQSAVRLESTPHTTRRSAARAVAGWWGLPKSTRSPNRVSARANLARAEHASQGRRGARGLPPASRRAQCSRIVWFS